MGKNRKRNSPRKKNNRGRSEGTKLAQESSTLTVYRGPIAPVGFNQANTVTVARLCTVIGVGTGITGVLTAFANNNPNGSSDWSSYQPLFTEYRVISFKATWVPFDAGFSGTAAPNLQRPAVQWIIRSGSYTFPSSMIQAWDNDGARLRNIGRQWSITVSMTGQPDSIWMLTASPGAYCTLGMYAEGLTASTVYGSWFFEYLTQFRSRI